MDKIKLEIAGLSYSQTQSGAYALVLQEVGGKRRLPIIIGGFETQAIVMVLEKMVPARPLTHDLFKSFSQAFDVKIKEIVIYNLQEGIFYAKLVCDRNGDVSEIDARTSDAIALAVRFECPVFTFENILATAGILEDDLEVGDALEDSQSTNFSKNEFEELSVDELNEQLEIAVDEEDYELASRLRDELNKRN
jgi:uncharacterized protein